MEHTNKIEKTKLFMVIGFYIVIALLTFTIVILVNNIKEIKKDPISYGIEKKDFLACRCQDEKMNNYYFNATTNIKTEDYFNTVDEKIPEIKCRKDKYDLDFNLTYKNN